MIKSDRLLAAVVPSERQMKLQDMEFYAFVHFTVNTFTDREWGDGTESPSVFDPARLDARQWVEAVKSAGMRGLILTCKHHDGFCLWPSRYTDHTVAASPFRGGRGDVVAETAEACREGGIAFGVYLSPWDRHSPLYGSGKPYDDYFVSQLTELLTGYGEICSVWFDGACGEGPNGKKQYYDWDRYYETVRTLQPGACIHICGPDIRWCGNEAGDTRESEWSVVPRRTAETEKVASLRPYAGKSDRGLRRIRAQDRDLGSREILKGEEDLIWYPAEVDTSIRPGWFWHESENDRVRPLEELIDIYEKSVGGNANLLLNIPPTRDGLFHENDVRRLREIGEYIRESYGCDLAPDAEVTADPSEAGHDISNVLKDDESFYVPDKKDGTAVITLTWDRARTIRRAVLREQIRCGQRVERFALDVRERGEWKEAAAGTVIGHKRIISFGPVETDALRIRILDARVAPTVRSVNVYA